MNRIVVQDCGTQVFWWGRYRRECKTHGVNLRERHFVPPMFAEWVAGVSMMKCCDFEFVAYEYFLAGLPVNWTSPSVGAVLKEAFAALFPPLVEACVFASHSVMNRLIFDTLSTCRLFMFVLHFEFYLRRSHH